REKDPPVRSKTRYDRAPRSGRPMANRRATGLDDAGAGGRVMAALLVFSAIAIVVAAFAVSLLIDRPRSDEM
ncbi:MAG TPA: hypothetical protein VKV96_19785, partial [Roseiarcus sp.]|nr:hypothetical protein [Roseiarcus sp.]